MFGGFNRTELLGPADPTDNAINIERAVAAFQGNDLGFRGAFGADRADTVADPRGASRGDRGPMSSAVLRGLGGLRGS